MSSNLWTSDVPSVGDQLVTAISQVVSSEDGTHEISLALHPEGLGTVKATVSVGPDEVVVRLNTDNQQGHDAIRQNLGDLREQLGENGSRQANVYLTEDAGGRARSGSENDSITTEPEMLSGGGSQAHEQSVTTNEGGSLVDIHI